MSKYLEDVRDMLCEELDEIGKTGKIGSDAALERIDMLTHSIKSIDTILAMKDAGYSERGYSYNYPRRYDDRDGRDYSEARRRDARGRYSGADDHEAVREHLEMAKREAADEKTRREIQRMIDGM